MSRANLHPSATMSPSTSGKAHEQDKRDEGVGKQEQKSVAGIVFFVVR